MKTKLKHNSRTILRIAVVFAAVIAIFCAVTAVAAEDKTQGYYVQIDDGGEVTALYTKHMNATDILRQAGVKITELDSLDLSSFVPGEDSDIVVKRSALVGVNDEKGTVYFTFDGTVDEAVKKSKVDVGKDDTLSVDADEEVSDGMIITVKKAVPVVVEDHGEIINVEAAPGTVGDVLNVLGVSGKKDDFISHSVEEEITEGMTISVDKITYKERTEKEEIPFKTIEKEDPELLEGKKETETKGVKGKQKVFYTDTYVNGVLSTSTKTGSEVIKEAVDEVVRVGTKKKADFTSGAYNVNGLSEPISKLGTVELDENGIPLHYSGIFSGKATAYSGGWGTASGLPACVGHVAVDPSIIPYGTRLYIIATDGTVYGYAIAADTGTFIERGDILVDVYMASYEESCQWGLKDVNMYVLD